MEFSCSEMAADVDVVLAMRRYVKHMLEDYLNVALLCDDLDTAATILSRVTHCAGISTEVSWGL